VNRGGEKGKKRGKKGEGRGGKITRGSFNHIDPLSCEYGKKGEKKKKKRENEKSIPG